MSRPITPHRTAQPIVTGHYEQQAGYFAYRPEGTEDFLLILTLGGGGRFVSPPTELSTKSGDMALLRPHAYHDYSVERSAGHWRLLWAHFMPRPHWLDLLDWPSPASKLHLLHLASDADRIISRFFDVHRYAQGTHSHRIDLAMNALEEVLLWCDIHNPRRAHARIDARISAVMDHVLADLSRRHDADDLAEVAGLSASRLAHLFREQTGLTLQHFVESQRILRARQLLELTDMPIKQMARLLGFSTSFYFSLRFKRAVGCSPSEYRRRSEGTGGIGAPRDEGSMV